MKTVPIESLYHRYPRQSGPQDCYVYLDITSQTLGMSYNPEVSNAMPMYVWHGLTLRWPIECLQTRYARQLLREIRPLARRLLAEASIGWDGSNHVGHLTKRGLALSDQIQDLCDRYDDASIHEWDAVDWFEYQNLTRRELQQLREGTYPQDGSEDRPYLYNINDYLAVYAQRQEAK